MDNFMLQQAPVKEFAEVARVSLNIEGYQSILRDIINMDPGEEWESGVIQQLLRRLYRCESGHIGTGYWALRTQANTLCGLLWGLFVCPVQTRQNNGTLQEQPEVTAVKWVWWPWHRDVYHEGNFFFPLLQNHTRPRGEVTKDGDYLRLLLQLEMVSATGWSVLLQRQIKDFMSS